MLLGGGRLVVGALTDLRPDPATAGIVGGE
jgi:hypothetical protein